MTKYGWILVENMPRSAVAVVGQVLLVIFGFILPNGAQDQEEMLELLLVWFFSGLALLPIIVLVASVRYEMRILSHKAVASVEKIAV